MNISSYQIFNVFKVLSKQLTRTEKLEAEEDVKLSAGGDRKTVIEKVARDIVKRISKYDPQVEGYGIDGSPVNRLPERQQGLNEMEFVYYIIDEKDDKITNTLSVASPGFIIRQSDRG